MQKYLEKVKMKIELGKEKKAMKQAFDSSIKAKAEGADKSKDASTAADLPKPGEVISGSQKAGCSRCGHATVGCLSCVGWKAARHFRRKDELASSSIEKTEKQTAPVPKAEPKTQQSKWPRSFSSASKTAAAQTAEQKETAPKPKANPKTKPASETAAAQTVVRSDAEDVE